MSYLVHVLFKPYNLSNVGAQNQSLFKKCKFWRLKKLKSRKHFQRSTSKLQQPWHQGSHFSSTSPELWGSVLALGILFPDHQRSQTGELVGPTWVVPVPSLQMPLQNLALLLDVCARKTRQNMKQQVASKVCSHTQIHAMQPVNHKSLQCDTRNGEQG